MLSVTETWAEHDLIPIKFGVPKIFRQIHGRVSSTFALLDSLDSIDFAQLVRLGHFSTTSPHYPQQRKHQQILASKIQNQDWAWKHGSPRFLIPRNRNLQMPHCFTHEFSQLQFFNPRLPVSSPMQPRVGVSRYAVPLYKPLMGDRSQTGCQVREMWHEMPRRVDLVVTTMSSKHAMWLQCIHTGDFDHHDLEEEIIFASSLLFSPIYPFNSVSELGQNRVS